MVRKKMSAAFLAPLATTLGSFIIGTDVLLTPSDLHIVRLPQGKRVHRTCRPFSAGFAMTKSHTGGLAGYLELHITTKTAAVVFELPDTMHLQYCSIRVMKTIGRAFIGNNSLYLDI
jgi:hypothetical protein